jgi:hypothetical protein
MIQLVPIVLAQVALLAGGHATVVCSPTIPLEGRAYEAAAIIEVKSYVCHNASAFSRDPTFTNANEVYSDMTTSRAWSLYVLAHEANHIAHPDFTEAQVTCAGLADVPRFAHALGATWNAGKRGEKIARDWVRTESPPQYQSACTT